MYNDNDYRLYHHGIRGQKWGDKNGPPYPLNPSDHSASEQKAGWRKSLASTIGNIRRKQQERKEANQIKKTQAAEKKAQEEKEAAEKKAQEEKEAAEKKAQEEKEAAEKEKRDLINSGDQEAIGKAAKEGKLTTKEFEEAVKKCELDQRLRNTMPRQETVNKMRDASAKLKDFSELAKNGIDLYNNLADVVNSFSPNTQMIKLDGSALRRFRDEQAAQARASEKAEQDRLWKVARSGDKDAIKADIDNMSSAQLQEANKHNAERAKFDKYVSDMDAKAKATKMSEADNDGRFDLASMLSKAQESEKDRKRQSTIRGDF